MKLSVVILTWNSERHIVACLSSILESANESFDSCEIFVVDNGSKDKTPEIIEKFANTHKGVIIPIYLNMNFGTTRSRNIALKEVSGDYVAIVDSDVVVARGVFHNLLCSFQEFPSAGLVVPKLVYPNGNFQKSTDDFPTIVSKFRRYLFLKNIEQIEGTKNNSHSQFVDYAISAFWLLKREVIKNVGLLDEKIFYAPEDVDYCFRIWQAGYKIVFVPTCEVVHDAQEISRGFQFNRAFREHLKGLIYYFVKHRYLWTKPHLG